MNDIPLGTPYLEQFFTDGTPPRRLELTTFPFLIGRATTAHLRIDSTQVSRDHARIEQAADAHHLIRDVGSTNGTFVNGQRVREAPLANGDVLQIGNFEFAYHSGVPETHQMATQVMDPRTARTSPRVSCAAVLRAVRRFQEMFMHRTLRVRFEPVVHLATSQVAGYAAVPPSVEGQDSAEHMVLSGESRLADRMFQLERRVAVEDARQFPAGCKIFLPVHSSEFGHEALIESLVHLAGLVQAGQSPVIELDESSIHDGPYLSRLRAVLSEQGLAWACSRFSAGRARWNELAAAGPAYLKLDRSVVNGLDRNQSRRKQLSDVLSECVDRGVQVVAVGLESAADARGCLELGCVLGEGPAFGSAGPLLNLAGAMPVASLAGA